MIEYWQDLTTTDFGKLDRESTLVILPVAAIEQHGPHLPLGTDLLINRGILAAAEKHLAKGLRVLVLPEQAVGDSLEQGIDRIEAILKGPTENRPRPSAAPGRVR